MKRDNMLIEPAELIHKLGSQNIRIYDASVSDGLYRQGHIPGAAFFNHDEFSDPSGKYMFTLLPGAELSAKIGSIGISNDTEVVLYAWGMIPYAARAWWVLHYAGHNHVRVLNGDLAAWEAAGGTTETEIRSYQPVRFEANLRANRFVNKETVLQAMHDPAVSTVNVLPAVSYQAAHITGSTNLPCLDLMCGTAAFLPDDQLAQFLPQDGRAQRVITYCGGGIAAAVNAMAHLMVGQENVAVYDGSMEEWAGEGLPLTGNGDWAIWKIK